MSSDKSISMRRDQSAPKADIDIADLVEEGVAVFDLNLVVSFWSDAAERIYGWKREEVIGGAIQDAVQCSPSQPLNVILDQVHRSGEWRGEIVRTTKNGGIVVVSTKWSLRRGADGEPLDIVETSRNITDAKAAEAALERSERRYREFFHFLPIALFQLDRKGLPAVLAKPRSEGVTDLIAYARTRPDFVAHAMDALQVVEVNRRAVDMLRGTSPDDFKGSVAPNWTESPEIFVDCLAAAYRGQKTYEAQIKIKARDGTILDVLFFAAFSPVTGGVGLFARLTPIHSVRL
jgi:PAS domain S-box-containing protein